jgi:hypothetical protein
MLVTHKHFIQLTDLHGTCFSISGEFYKLFQAIYCDFDDIGLGFVEHLLAIRKMPAFLNLKHILVAIRAKEQ